MRRDDRNLLIEAQDAGYSIVTHPAALADVTSLPVLGLFAASGMQSGTEWWAEQDSQSPSQPALHTMAIRALELLSADDVGLFVMIEGGQIDWAGHNNESQRLLYEMLRFDRTVGDVLDLEGIALAEHDVVLPGVDTRISKLLSNALKWLPKLTPPITSKD